MKKTILLFTGLLLASGAFAQITLSSGSYPVSVTGTDSLKVTTATSAFPSLTAMANGSWDLSAVTDSTPVLYSYIVTATTAPATFADSNFYSLGTYAYQGNIQSAVTASGLMEYGINVQEAGYSLTSVTGGLSDSLIIPLQSSVYSTARTRIAFPATYNTTWSSTYHFDFNFLISVAAASLSHTVGLARTYTTEVDSVKGWGVMRVKDLTGSPSSWFSVLQVQTKTTTVDSFSLGGSFTNPVLPTLLMDLGLTQGQVTTTYEQNYYRPNEVTAFANVQFTDSTYSTPTKATTHTQRLANTAVKNLANNSGVNVYPNPVSGNQVSIDLPAIGGTWAYELIDMSGKTAAAAALQTNGTHAQFSLPSSVTPGIYYIRLNNNGVQVAVKSIDVIK